MLPRPHRETTTQRPSFQQSNQIVLSNSPHVQHTILFQYNLLLLKRERDTHEGCPPRVAVETTGLQSRANKAVQSSQLYHTLYCKPRWSNSILRVYWSGKWHHHHPQGILLSSRLCLCYTQTRIQERYIFQTGSIQRIEGLNFMETLRVIGNCVPLFEDLESLDPTSPVLSTTSGQGLHLLKY